MVFMIIVVSGNDNHYQGFDPTDSLCTFRRSECPSGSFPFFDVDRLFCSNTYYFSGGTRMKKWFLLSLAGLMLFLAACGNKEENKDMAAEPDTDTYTVEHAMGSTEIKGTPER